MVRRLARWPALLALPALRQAGVAWEPQQLLALGVLGRRVRVVRVRLLPHALLVRLLVRGGVLRAGRAGRVVEQVALL